MSFANDGSFMAQFFAMSQNPSDGNAEERESERAHSSGATLKKTRGVAEGGGEGGEHKDMQHVCGGGSPRDGDKEQGVDKEGSCPYHEAPKRVEPQTAGSAPSSSSSSDQQGKKKSLLAAFSTKPVKTIKKEVGASNRCKIFAFSALVQTVSLSTFLEC